MSSQRSLELRSSGNARPGASTNSAAHEPGALLPNVDLLEVDLDVKPDAVSASPRFAATTPRWRAGGWLIAAVAAAACLSGGAYYFPRGHTAVYSEPPPNAVRVRRLQVSQRDALVLRGVVAAGSRLRLGFKHPGVVHTIAVREGSPVKAGQLLATLDRSDATAQVAAAEAMAQKARRDFETAERLVSAGAQPRHTLDDSRNQMEVAEASLTAAREAMNRTELTAPVAGTIYQRLAEPGETVGAGMPLLLLDETERLLVRVGVTERDLGDVQRGQRTRLVLDSGAPALSGRITSIAPSPNPADGLYMVQLAPEGQSEALRPGSLIAVHFSAVKDRSVLRIPLEALVHRQDRDWVFTVDAGSAPQVHLQPVSIDRSEGRDYVIKAGLRGDERIVVEGAFFLQDMQTVRPIDEASQP